MNAQSVALPRLRRLDLWLPRLALALGGLFGLVQWAAPGLIGGDDGYYHLKLAALMRGDLVPQFTWLPLTILSPERFVDHHWLFHILLMPFASGDLVVAGQVAAAVFATAALAAAGWVLRRQAVPGAGLWALGMFAASSAFVYRLSMPRAQSLSLLWLILAVQLLLERRERWLIVLGLTYVWLYDAFPLLLVVAGLYVAAARLIEGRWRWGALGYSALGITLGLLINPYFPHNLIFILHHLSAKLDPTSIPVGSEWYPYTTAVLLKNSGLSLAALIAGAAALGWHKGRLSLAGGLALGLSLAFGVMMFQSRRFVEYFPPFAVMFCAFAWQPLLQNQQLDRWLRALAGVGLAAALAATTLAARAAVSNDPPAGRMAGAAEWLAAHTPQGSLVFQTDWDDFPTLFFYNTHNAYTVGLDPTYLELADPARYALWVDLTQGRGLDLSAAIVKHFGAHYIVSDLKHTAFLRRAAADPHMQEVYRDSNSVVFAIIDPIH
jgi:hypothetical protein